MGPDDLVRLIVFVVMIGLVGFFIAGLWKVLEKAGEPGWKVLLPIYNSVVVLRIAGMSRVVDPSYVSSLREHRCGHLHVYQAGTPPSAREADSPRA